MLYLSWYYNDVMSSNTGNELLKIGVYGLVAVLSVGYLYGALVGIIIPRFSGTVIYRISLGVLGLLIGFILVWKNSWASGLGAWKQVFLAFLLAYLPYLVALIGLALLLYEGLK